MKKRLISLLLAFSMMLTFLPVGAVSAFAEGNPITYDCGQNVTATLSRNNDGDETYTLTITGNGPMANYEGYKTSSNNSCAPWCEKIQNITRLIVGDGVTTLGDDILSYSYYDSYSDYHSFHPDLREVKLPDGLTCIGARAFCNSPALTEVEIPNTVTNIKSFAFSGCTGLTEIELPPQLEEVAGGLFSRCSGLTKITIPSSVQKIGARAFQDCTNLESVTLPEGIREIEYNAFSGTNLKSLNIPKSVERLEYNIVGGCENLAYITIEPKSQLKEIKTGFRDGVFNTYTKVYCEPRLLSQLPLNNSNESAHFITTVDVTLVDGDTITPKKIPYGANIAELGTELGTPTKPGYTFAGWYTDEDCKTRYPETQLFTNIHGTTTLYAGWKFDTNALSCRTLTVTGGTVTVKYDGSDVNSTLNIVPDDVTGDKKTYSVPDGAEVTVTLDKTQIPEGMVFDLWTTGSFSLPSEQNYKAETITFTMKESVDIAAQYRDATIEDDGSTVLGTAAMIGTAVVGTMVLGYQAYSLGTEFAGYLMDLPYFPANRSALAVMLWEDAGKPMPESEQLYPDVGQEEQDMDLQHAARWAMENDLIPDRNEEGTAPEEMKFYPDNAVSRIDVLKAWQKAQELKKNA